MEPYAQIFGTGEVIAVAAAIFGIITTLYYSRVMRGLDREREEIMDWLDDPDTQRRIREMEASGRTIEYSDNVKRWIRKSRGK